MGYYEVGQMGMGGCLLGQVIRSSLNNAGMRRYRCRTLRATRTMQVTYRRAPRKHEQ